MASPANIELLGPKNYVAAVEATDCWLAFCDPKVRKVLLDFTKKEKIPSIKVQKPLLQQPSPAASPRRKRPRLYKPRQSSPRAPYKRIAPKPAVPCPPPQSKDRPNSNPPTPPERASQALEQDCSGVKRLISFIDERLRRHGDTNTKYMRNLADASLRPIKPQWKSIAEYYASIFERRYDGVHLAGMSLALIGENKDDPEFCHQFEKLEEETFRFPCISAKLMEAGLEIIVLITADCPSM